MLETVWNIKKVDQNKVDELAYAMELPRPVAAVFVGRDLDTSEKVDDFCSLGVQHLHSPFLLPDIEPAIERLSRAIDNKEHIHVHGDYDVDGVTSTAIVVFTLRKLGANFTYHVPHRITEGYDVRARTVEEAKEAGAELLMTVDCGIVAFEAAERAHELGLDLIITDHHHPSNDGRLPRAIAVINPNRHDSQYPFPDLAGCGIAFKLMSALAERRGIPQKVTRHHLLDFVALGTVADVTPMYDENRTLVHLGCQQLLRADKAGIQQLLRVAQVKSVNVGTIGFALGPRINAVGRISSPMSALNLMLETSPSDAAVLANQLDSANKRRREMQEQAEKEAKEMIPEDLSDTSILVLAAKNWHPGLVGLVAGNMARDLGRPALVLTIKDGMAKGSARSAQGFNLINALLCDEVRDLWAKRGDGTPVCGGHAFAAGFTLPEENVPILAQRLNDYAKRVTGGGIAPVRLLDIDARIQPGDITRKTYDLLSRMAPFGSMNPEPIFAVKGMVVHENKVLKEKHLKLRLKGKKEGSNWIDAMVFWLGPEADKYPPGACVDVVFKLSINEFMGRESLQMMVEDIRLSED